MPSVNANPLEVDLVLDIRHKNEGCDDTLALGCGSLGADLAIPNVVCRCEQCSNCVLGHCQERRLLAAARVGVDGRRTLRLPVDLRRVTEVLVDALDIAEGVERICARLANGSGYARIERVRHERVATAEAESADTAITVYYEAVSSAT